MNARKLLMAGAIAVAVVGMPAVAMADDYVGGNDGGQVLGTQLSRSTSAAPTPVAAPATTSRGAGLPVTGGDVAGLTAVGLASIGAGTVLVRRSRRGAKTANA
jgi:LPXTG-motif cell wall-anchored protein